MTRLLAFLALAGLAACSRAPAGDWREAVGRTTPNLRVIQPLPPLVIPPALGLPTPAQVAPAVAAAVAPPA